MKPINMSHAVAIVKRLHTHIYVFRRSILFQISILDYNYNRNYMIHKLQDFRDCSNMYTDYIM